MTARRVVVTGMGLVCPLGSGVEPCWNRLVEGQSGIRAVSGFSVDDLPCRVAGQIPRGDEKEGYFEAERYIEPKELRKVDYFIVFAIAAAEQAIADSGWNPESRNDRERSGVLIGSGIGGLGSMEEAVLTMSERGPRRVSPFFIPSALINLASGYVSIRHGFLGPNLATVTACSTGAHAIGDAGELIRRGVADVMIAGGAEAAICRLGIAGFCAVRALSTHFNDHPSQASRPWDRERDGFVMGEGAGIVVLEELEHAVARGARIYAELSGYGVSSDAYHITSPPPDGKGGLRSMQAALRYAGLEPSRIDYINAHGTSTPLGDKVELSAVKDLLGPSAEHVSMSSTKSSVGHMLGAAGSAEAIFSIQAINSGIIPPTLNLHNPSEDYDIDLVPLKAKEREVNHALSNSFGFGGTNATLIFSRLL